MSLKATTKKNKEYRVCGEFPSGTSFASTVDLNELKKMIKRGEKIISVNGYYWKE
jgi:hypothetical protein